MIIYDRNRLDKSRLSTIIKEQILNNRLELREYESINFFDSNIAFRNRLQCEFNTDEYIDPNAIDKNEPFPGAKWAYNELSKFNDYLIIGTVCEYEEGGLAAIFQDNGEIYELDHDVTDVVLAHFLNSSFRQMEECVLLYEEYFLRMNNVKKIKDIYIRDESKVLSAGQIEMMFDEISKKLCEIDENIFNSDKEQIVNRYHCKLAWKTILYFGKRTIYNRYRIKFSE